MPVSLYFIVVNREGSYLRTTRGQRSNEREAWQVAGEVTDLYVSLSRMGSDTWRAATPTAGILGAQVVKHAKTAVVTPGGLLETPRKKNPSRGVALAINIARRRSK